MPSLLIKVRGKFYSQLLHSSDLPLYTNGGIIKFIEFSIRNSNTIMGVCKSRNPTRNTRNLPGTPGTPPGTPGTLPGTPGTLPGTPGNPPGTPGTPHGTRWNTSYEATHMFLYKFTCFALISG